MAIWEFHKLDSLYRQRSMESQSEHNIEGQREDLIREKEEIFDAQKRKEFMKKSENIQMYSIERLQEEVCLLQQQYDKLDQDREEMIRDQLNERINNQIRQLRAMKAETVVLSKWTEQYSRLKNFSETPVMVTPEMPFHPFPLRLSMGPLFDRIHLKCSSEREGEFVAIDYAVVNGCRIAVYPIPKIQLNWKEINVAYSVLSSYLLCYRNSLDLAEGRNTIAFHRSSYFFPKTKLFLLSTLKSRRIRWICSKLAEYVVPVEMKVIPWSDRAVIAVSGGAAESVRYEEYLHLEGGIQVPNHGMKKAASSSGSILQQIMSKLEDRERRDEISPVEEESVPEHYLRSVLGLISAFVFTKLQLCEKLLDYPSAQDGHHEQIIFKRLFPDPFLLEISLSILLDLPLPCERPPREFFKTLLSDSSIMKELRSEYNEGMTQICGNQSIFEDEKPFASSTDWRASVFQLMSLNLGQRDDFFCRDIEFMNRLLMSTLRMFSDLVNSP